MYCNDSDLFLLQLSTVMELLEGAFYGMDLLKLHSVTTKLLNRVDNIEKVCYLTPIGISEWAVIACIAYSRVP